MSASSEPIEAISQRVDTFVSTQRESVAEAGAESALFLAAAAAALSGGKRLRGRFCLAGWRAVEEASQNPRNAGEAVISAAAALEIFHAAALVHDDVIDNSDTRRGRPAAHRALEAVHRRAAWAGDPVSFGRSAAILLGDLLVAWSDDLFEEALASAAWSAGAEGDASSSSAVAARSEYATMRREVTLGQFLDVAEESAFRAQPNEQHAERALRVASYKSARYSIQRPLGIGAALAGADVAQAAALAAFGHPLGMAFQLRDDVLGVFGDERETGKPSGDDLREGKRTVLVAYAREAATPTTRRLIDELVGDPGLDAEQIAALQQMIADSGALGRVERLIADYAEEADGALAGARLGEAAVAELRDLARAATVRTG